jgi:predicted phage terminase large subunit-like protein
MTRWHADDLAGWLIAGGGGASAWEVLNLPALAEEDDPLGREPGEALWPERYDRAALAEIRKSANVGEYFFSAMFQGRPVPRSGGMFRREWFPIVAAAPAVATRVRFWDMASSTTGDYTAGVRMARIDPGIYYVEDVVRGRWTPHERDRVILQTAQIDGRSVPVRVEQEPGSAGVSVVAATVKLLAGYAIRGERPTGDKATRAAPFASQCEAGNVRLVAGGWIRDFLEEIELFPVAKHDDQADACSGCFNALAEAPAPAVLRPAANPLAGYRG